VKVRSCKRWSWLVQIRSPRRIRPIPGSTVRIQFFAHIFLFIFKFIQAARFLIKESRTNCINCYIYNVIELENLHLGVSQILVILRVVERKIQKLYYTNIHVLYCKYICVQAHISLLFMLHIILFYSIDVSHKSCWYFVYI
jgi:hypothetical protein